ncbi:WGR domain-containing protein [Paracoccus beibuensis]|uniref:WGR domain-containing protein n=1 Tax=Paracoccus beibuensis TaxID=547602 RepID=UPI00223FD01E|nr:WGR domain-containing protein [Paracoccus beibuensis]
MAQMFDRSTTLFRRDSARNMARFYRIEIEPDLFGGFTVTRRWGRIGCKGQQRRRWFADVLDAQDDRDSWTSRKKRRGYWPLE